MDAKLTDALVGGAVGIAGALVPVVTHGATATALGVVVGGLSPLMSNLISDVLARYQRTRSKHFLEGYVSAHKSEAEAQEVAEKHKDDPDYQTRMYQAFRFVMDAVDDSVIETIGYLAGQYDAFDKPRKADAYFRGMGRLLCDLEAGQLEELRAFFKMLNDIADSLERCLDWDHKLNVIVDPRSRTNEVSVHFNAYSVVNRDLCGSFPSANRLFHLLRTNDLVPTYRKVDGHIEGITVDLLMCKRIRCTIDPQPTT
jgi:hypothetical protein